MSKKVEMKDIVNLSQTRGFVYPGSEIYGGLANSWDYGPYGSLLKENIKNLWIKEFVQKKDDMMLLDSSILLNPRVWVASGHVGGFSDPLIDDKNTKERFRADKLLEALIDSYLDISNIYGILIPYIEDREFNLSYIQRLDEYYNYIEILERDYLVIENSNNKFKVNIKPIKLDPGNEKYNNEIIKLVPSLILKLYLSLKYNINNLIPESWSLEKQTEVMRGEAVKNPNTGNLGDWTDAKKFNLMFRTFQGVTEDSSATVYLRPETAQGIFVDFPNVLRTSRRKIPFGVAQVGKAFRNEITPGNFIFRTREFEQMEIEYFCEPGKDLEAHAMWKENCKNFLTNTLGIKEENLRLRDHDKDELSHYSNATTDIEYKFPFGFGELWGIADRTDFDLKAHMSESKADMSYFDPVNNRKFIPYVIEPSVGLNRLFLVSLCDAYTVDGEGEEQRIYLKLDPKVAPIKVGVLPVVKKIGEDAKKIYKQLSEDFICEYDEVGTIGKRYARFDEIGTPFCVTIDSQNFEEGKVTVRYRDSMEQELVEISELNEFLRKKMK